MLKCRFSDLTVCEGDHMTTVWEILFRYNNPKHEDKATKEYFGKNTLGLLTGQINHVKTKFHRNMKEVKTFYTEDGGASPGK